VPSKLLKKAFSLDNLERSWRVIHENGRSSLSDDVRNEIEKFSEDASANLRRLQRRLATNRFAFAAAKGVTIEKRDASGKPSGRFRPIVCAPVESRIVQRALLNVLLEVPALKPFIETAYSFGGLRKKAQDQSRTAQSLSGVPAAINSVLRSIEAGSRFFIVADIAAFFTKIPKPAVRAIVSDAVSDDEFMSFFDKAIAVELANMAQLRERADAFPIEAIGVAQGNSLSPLLGNILLHDFDAALNAGDCSCFRYIDDFIITAPSAGAANARLKRARALLDAFGMQLSVEKTAQGAVRLQDGIEFLGIQICPGFVRPTGKAQLKLLSKVDAVLERGRQALLGVRKGQHVHQSDSFLETMRRVSGTVDGWGKHYWFCNDRQVLKALDLKIWKKVLAYMGCYSQIRNEVGDTAKPALLGLAELATTSRAPFVFPALRVAKDVECST
jgi:retron-type reverse transcriptase